MNKEKIISFMVSVPILIGFIVGQIYDIQGFVNFAVIWEWIISVLLILAFLADKLPESKLKRFPVFGLLTDIVIIGMFAYYGYAVLAVFLTLSVIMGVSKIRIENETASK